MREFLTFMGCLIAAVAFVGLLWIGGGFLGLWWYPYSIQMQTAIVRQSNSYVTAHQQDLVQLMMGLTADGTTEGQKNAIYIQMCQEATLIPEHVPQGVAQTLAGRCN